MGVVGGVLGGGDTGFFVSALSRREDIIMRYSAEPLLILDKQGTLDLIALKQWPVDKWRIKSTWICDTLNEYEKDGYVYNAIALRRIEKENNLPAHDENGSILSILIYNAQQYRREDKYKADGFVPLTPDIVQTAMREKRMVEVLGENLIGGIGHTACRPVIRGSVYAVMLPRKRTRGFIADGSHLARLA